MKEHQKSFRMRYILSTFLISVSIFLHSYDSNLPDEVILLQYVARDEIIAFEKARIRKSEYPPSPYIFFGRVNEALKLLEEIVHEKNQQKNHFVIITNTRIADSSFKSISEEVHSEIIRRLQLEPY